MNRLWARMVPFLYAVLFALYRSWWALIPFVVLLSGRADSPHMEAWRVALFMLLGLIVIVQGVSGFTRGLQYERDGEPGEWVLHFTWLKPVLINGRPYRGFYRRRVVRTSLRGMGQEYFVRYPDQDPNGKIERQRA